MDIEVIKRKVSASLERLNNDDSFLIKNDVSERAITHKLAIYIADEFAGYDVDCEYNSNVQNDRGKKYIYFIREKAEALNLLRDRDGDDEVILRMVYPDIIVHKRGVNDSNLLIIEVKKSNSQISSEYDYEKLSRYTSTDHENDLNYQYGVFIKLGVNHSLGTNEIIWFINGERS